ncbi:plastocyanin/azurin family copper-binding protein [Fulvivirgaceae bacterium BMA10]|uniref:Plastocyanin/azurin family copper-binding protein n=1 Tax=Splendidivirga corallicola TaxID=3051826 RepID=A0ABT8KTP0_9BACT|nr:plastocyanin/azurin family copper-binding protein [Fulvivirgaceae bacterium BMA10]
MRERALRIVRTGIVLFLGLIFYVGCSSSTENKKEERKPAPKVHTVEIKQMKFVPAELHVNKGDTVLFINNDLVAHDVTEEPNGSWTSSALQASESWALQVTQSADYYCSLHIVMKGKIIVD